MYRLRSRMPETSSPICGYIRGSPPQIETTGAPHSSTAARHSSSGTRSVMVDSYSRMRPQPVQVRLQACSGSSISTMGKRLPIMGCGWRLAPALGGRMRNGLDAGHRRRGVLLPLRTGPHLVPENVSGQAGGHGDGKFHKLSI
jgi:hypothetical protein